jgi:hypothetical protein
VSESWLTEHNPHESECQASAVPASLLGAPRSGLSIREVSQCCASSLSTTTQMRWLILLYSTWRRQLALQHTTSLCSHRKSSPRFHITLLLFQGRLPDYFGREMHARCATSPNPRSPGRGVFQAAVLFAPLSLQSPRHAVWYSRRKRRVFVHSLRLRKAVLQLTPILRSARKLRTSEAALQSFARYGRLAF